MSPPPDAGASPSADPASPPTSGPAPSSAPSKKSAPPGGPLAGGVAALHKTRTRLPLYVAPTTDDGKNTIRLPLLPVACWRLDDLRFEFDSSFVRPEAADEFAALAALHASNAGAPFSIFGHADPTGDDDYNKKLSGRRAEAVYGVLVRDVARWEALYANKLGGDEWGVHAIQRMLAGLGLDPGAVDGKMGPHTKQAVQYFQTSKGLAADGDAGPDTRKALFADYMDAICQDASGAPFVLTAADFLAQGTDADLRGDVQGCGEFNLVLVLSQDETTALSADDRHHERDAINLPNRRVLVFLFPPGSQIDLSVWPCPAAQDGAATCKESFWSNGDDRRNPSDARRNYAGTHDTMACRFYDRIARGSPCEVTRKTLVLRLLNPDNEAIPDAIYRLTLTDGQVREGQADEKGYLVEQNVAVPDSVTLEWGYPTEFGVSDEERAKRWVYEGPYGYRLDIDLAPDEADTDEERTRNRLVNLGYSPSCTLEENLIAFQTDYEVFPADGALDDRTKDAIVEAYGEGLSKDEFIAKHASDNQGS